MKKRIARAFALMCTGCMLTAAAIPDISISRIADLSTASSENEIELGNANAGAMAATIIDIDQLPEDVVAKSVLEAKKDAAQKAKKDQIGNLGYNNLGLADVDTILNVRESASKSANIVGRMPKDAACDIESFDGDWAKISSGKVKGYAKSSYLLTGKNAIERADALISDTVTVNASALRVREDASTDSQIITMAMNGSRLTVADKNTKLSDTPTVDDSSENKGSSAVSSNNGANKDSACDADVTKDDGWLEVRLEGDKIGYVASEYVTETKELETAESVDAVTEPTEDDSGGAPPGESAPPGNGKNEQQQVNDAQNDPIPAPIVDEPKSENGDSSDNASKNTDNSRKKKNKKKTNDRSDANVPADMDPAGYALQFVGNPYRWGGTSLTGGADCSGFVMSVYAHFGISLPHSSSAQSAYGTAVSSKDAKRGDLFFYGSGGISHVAIYIGNGQIVHASNRRDGIKVSNAFYRSPVCVRRLLEVR